MKCEVCQRPIWTALVALGGAVSPHAACHCRFDLECYRLGYERLRDLYEALKTMVLMTEADLEGGPLEATDEWVAAYRAGRAALAKAEGRSAAKPPPEIPK